MPNGTDTPPNTTDGNPFSLIAYVLFRVRHALEDMESGERPPRWIRIGRAAPYRTAPLGVIVRAAVEGMAETFSFMIELTLELEELLYQADALAAMGQVALRLFEAVGEDPFKQGVRALVGNTTADEIDGILDTVGRTARDIDRVLDYVPSPEDVQGIGHELYRLMCIVQPPFPRNSANQIDTVHPDLHAETQVDVMETGKVRLLAWAYGLGVWARGLRGVNNSDTRLTVRRFGLRRLYRTAMNNELPQRARLPPSSDVDADLIYDIRFNNDTATSEDETIVDLVELIGLLRARGYEVPALPATPSPMSIDAVLRENLLRFQAINQLPVTGELDNDTINRLFNLDYRKKNLRRARPYNSNFVFPWGTTLPTSRALSGDLTLINPSADRWEDEGVALTPSSAVGRYPYYRVTAAAAGLPPWPRGQGWLNEMGTPPAAIGSFVALHSRAINPADSMQSGRFAGGVWTEGDSAHGTYFWAARHVEPWRAGRNGEPGQDALFGRTQVPPGTISRMYQWIPLPTWLTTAPDNRPGWTLYVSASVLQRSLFQDRASVTRLPDQGRIILEIYDGTAYVVNSTTPNLRDESKPPRSMSATEFFPTAAFTDAVTLPPATDVDRARLWVLRSTARLAVPAGAVALCLVVEGRHQSAWDTDAYFDDFRVTYEWTLP